MKQTNIRKEIMKVLVGYDKRYTVASLTILTDSIIQIFKEVIGEDEKEPNPWIEEDGVTIIIRNEFRKELLKRLGK